MLISIKTKDSARLWKIPVPFHFIVNLFLRKGLILGIARLSSRDYESDRAASREKDQTYETEGRRGQNQPKDQSIEVLEKWLDTVDLAALRQSIHELKAYRGLALVDIVTGDGDVIKIVL